MNLAEQLFKHLDVRQWTPEETLYRIVEEYLADADLDLWRVTWDWYDSSVEIYTSNKEPLNYKPPTVLWDNGFSSVWIHPSVCSKDGTRNMNVCKCPRLMRYVKPLGFSPSEGEKP